MSDLIVVGLLTLGCSGGVGLVGLLVLRLLRGRSVTVHVGALVVLTTASVVAGVVAVCKAMFISEHDLTVLLVVLAVAGLVSLAVGLWAGRRLAQESVWAREARDRERQLERSRREVVAWVSHDLRTPLAGMRAMAEALEDGVVSDAATVGDYHRRIRVETDRMAGLVDDLFEMSRINAGALCLTLEAVSLADVVSDAVATADPLARAKGVRLVAQHAGYGLVRGSEPELGRVVANLLLNAIRHTPAEAVVSVTGGADTDGGWIEVTDGCGGIPEEDLSRVFDVAFRGEAARTPVSTVAADNASGIGTGTGNGGAAHAGGGLGLAIARGLVEAHHGEIGVINVEDGCRFTVRIPAPTG
ncbi:MAG TPA: HAMP domain-containing sensor histidine kinase [Cryptosporangiaceae bacterium]|nr:HAMP domain-containing sensor histidine kinase [Cryptosporangiaceae bacterium]